MAQIRLPLRRRDAAALAVGAAVLAQPRIARALLQRNLRRLRAGDAGPLLRFYADDVRFRFPGSSTWAVELTSRRALERWLARFVETGLQLHADEIVVSGPPWRTTVCLRCSDHLRAPDGTVVYENRAVIWGTARWGRIREYEVYEDTERTLALDAWLARRRPAAAG